MRQMTAVVRQKIKTYIKNGIDISKLIEGYSLKGENLAGAKIKNFNRSKQDMRGTDFSRCVIGTKGTINNVSGCNFQGSIWCDCEIAGTMFARRCNFRDSDFSGAVFANVEYQFTDFTGAKFCEACVRLGSDYGMGAKFDTSFFKDLTKGWNIKVCLKTPEELEEEGISG